MTSLARLLTVFMLLAAMPLGAEPSRDEADDSDQQLRAIKSPAIERVQSPTVDGRMARPTVHGNMKVQGNAEVQAVPNHSDGEAASSESGSGTKSDGDAVEGPAKSKASVKSHANRRIATEVFEHKAGLNQDGKPVCGPFHVDIPHKYSAGEVAPALAVYRGKLHLVAQNNPNCSAHSITGLDILAKELCNDERFPLYHHVFENGRWSQPTLIPNQLSKKGVGLAASGNHLHMVHLGNSSNQIWHSTYDGQGWSRNVQIKGQKSKKRPVLATFKNQLHMLHLGDSSNDLWHSRYVPGRGWTRNVRIGQKSRFTPALAEYRGRLHMVRTSSEGVRAGHSSLLHASFDGRKWRKHSTKIPGQTSAAPALVFDTNSGKPWLELVSRNGSRLRHTLFSVQRGWFDSRSLADVKSESPAAVAFYNGCWHMVSVGREAPGYHPDQLKHTTFGTSDIHPDF